jgi:hypothetical protein
MFFPFDGKDKSLKRLPLGSPSQYLDIMSEVPELTQAGVPGDS